jgi:group II intron reverse transcriptase/maturase
MGFLEELAAIPTLRRAWESVAAKRGVAGIDRVSVGDFGARLEAELERLSEEIRVGKYRPLPALRIRPAFLAPSDRALVVPAVRDRVVQRAIADLLSPQIDPLLSPACRAFRKGSSARAAADDVGRWIEEGEAWVLRTDVKSFFDSVQPEVLKGKLTPFVDEEGLRFLDRVLRCRIFDRDEVSEMITGIAQGSPLSPLLGNLYLSELDAAVEKEFPRYIRYCDDLLVLGAREEDVVRARERVASLLAPLGLRLNEEKSRVCRAEDGFVFLGYHFGPAGRGPAVRAVEALGFRLAEIAAGEELDLGEIDALYRGWTNYFGRHPQCWTGSPAGVLALLRNEAEEPEAARRLAEARWRLATPVSPQVGFALAEAWAARGHEEQSWLELAAACGGSRSDVAGEERWARLLRVRPEVLLGLARRLVGAPAERLAALSEAVAEAGRYAVASRLAAARTGAMAAEPESATGGSGAIAAEDLRVLESWFQGREGVHATESVDRAGHRSFVPVQRPILADDWRAHLRGERTLALPLVRAGDTALLGVLDVDLERRLLDERPGEVSELLGRALGAALRLRAELARRGAPALLERSGQKGYHLWVRLAEPVPCHALRRWLLAVVEAVGPLPEGVRVEEFPNRDRVRPEAIGPVVKLPLGVHSKTGNRCALLDDLGQEVADPVEVIRALPRVPAETISGAPAAPAPEAGAAQAEPPPAIGPRAQRMLEGCHVLGYLSLKSERTSYLNHRERWSLLCALGHLGEEGRAALHSIIGHTYNYRREVTERNIERLPPWPISCPKLRELHPESVAAGTCSCQFDLRGRGYPTPVLYALRPSEVPAFRQWKDREPRKGEGEKEAGGGEQQEAEDKVKKIVELKRHRRGIEAALDRLQGELAAVFEAAGSETLQLSMGVLRRVRRVEGDGWDFVIEV